MKHFLFICAFLLSGQFIFSQHDKRNDFTGQYLVDFYPSRKIILSLEDNHLIFEIVSQGKTELTLLSGNTYKVEGLPNSTVEFFPDSINRTMKFKWVHVPFKGAWKRSSNPVAPFPSPDSANTLNDYAGKYVQKGNGYLTLNISVEGDHLISQMSGESRLAFQPLEKNKFIFKKDNFIELYEFKADKKGVINEFNSTESGPIACTRMDASKAADLNVKHSFTKRTWFSAADTLQGTLTPLRTCYDVLFYDLDVSVDPELKSIQGTTKIRFRSVSDFTSLQVDLFANLKIEKIIYNHQSLSFTRIYDAVFIQFPETIKKEMVGEIEILYGGVPRIPDMSKFWGGFIWAQDHNGKPWIEVVSQGSGASLWWPCKDHLYDKPDSMHISITVPAGLTAVSNGQFVGKTDLPEHLTRFQWAVHYPINTYNAVVYIGDYTHISDQYSNGVNHFALNYYCLSYNLEIAQKFVQRVKPLLEYYQNTFGPYPFPNDGFALVESPYGMEHQSAVTLGSFMDDPEKGKPSDTTELTRMLYHESSHEWWGNSVTCSDYADFWIHESFASYAEILSYENFYGAAAAEKYIKEQVPDNKEPIIGYYGVNDFHMGDMYPKGARMIATLRTAINNDSLFFSILKGIQKKYAYQSIRTAEIINYFNEATGTDYTYVFDQYLRHASIPKLILVMTASGKDVQLRYKWEADVADFRLPVKLSTAGGEQIMLYPTTEWKSIQLQHTGIKDVQADNRFSYFDLKTE